MSNILKKLEYYRLEVVAILAAISHFAISIDRNNLMSLDNWKYLSVLFFFSTIVVSISTIRKNLSEVKDSLETSSLFIRNVAKPTNEDALLEYVLRMGAFHTIDTSFWVAYAEELEMTDNASTFNKIKKVLRAIDNNTIIIHPNAVYPLMDKLLMRIIEKNEIYYGTASINELKQADKNANHFLLKLPLDYPKDIVRIIFVSDEKELQELPDNTKLMLKKQLYSGVKLYFDSKTKESERINFGVYGNLAVGMYDEEERSNKLVFCDKQVCKYKAKMNVFISNFGTSQKLEEKHL